MYFVIIYTPFQDASIKRLADIEANNKGLKKRSATIKSPRKTQMSPKRTAIVNPLPMRKLQKAKSESNSEIDVSTNISNQQSNPADENKTETSKRSSKSRSEERKQNEVTFTSPRRSPKKKFEIKCK